MLAVHGSIDDTVPLVYSQFMVDGVNSNGSHAELIKIDGYGHNDGIDYTYRCTKVIDWLTKQRRTDFMYVPEVCEELF